MAIRSYRPRFSLRLLLACFTLVVAWLAWNLYVVERRKSIIEELGGRVIAKPIADASKTHDYRGKAALDSLLQQVDRQVDGSAYYEAAAAADLPWIRQQMGDRAYRFIGVYDSTQVAIVRKWFPEAVCARKWVLSNHH